jgi:hypothetical protein
VAIEETQRSRKVVRKDEADRMLLRLPHDLMDWIENEAKRNGASKNSEIIRSVRARMDERQPEKVVG